VHDKQVRRRRAVLLLLVVGSLILLTAYFGQASNSPLHSVQRGVVDVFSPIQEGASKVLSPVRDLAGWVSDTVHAKSQNSQLKQEVDRLRQENAVDQMATTENRKLLAELKLDNIQQISSHDPVSADVISYNPSVWYETITVDRGTSAGIKQNDPVIGNEGLVGIVSSVGNDWAVVSELSSHNFAAGATVLNNGSSSTGVLQPQVGSPTTLELNYLPQSAQQVVNNGDQVVTSGFSDKNDSTVVSYYPPGIPIGTVQNVSYEASTNALQVQVTPYVSFRNLSVVQILTKRYAGSGANSG
jgi:rod shape-determining protein MreC